MLLIRISKYKDIKTSTYVYITYYLEYLLIDGTDLRKLTTYFQIYPYTIAHAHYIFFVYVSIGMSVNNDLLYTKIF